MHFSNVFNDPGLWCMASGTIRPNSLVMQIGMAIDTPGFCFRKYQRGVALPAISDLVLPHQREFGSIVIKRVYPLIELPPF